MKYYWIESTIEMKTQVTKNTFCVCKMRGEGNMPLLNVPTCWKGVSPDTKMYFPTTGVP